MRKEIKFSYNFDDIMALIRADIQDNEGIELNSGVSVQEHIHILDNGGVSCTGYLGDSKNNPFRDFSLTVTTTE